MIELKSICKKFEDKIIFDDLNFKFDENKIYIINGESGIGKTTLLNIIYGYDVNFEGTCSVKQNIKIGYMFQDDLLFNNITVLENLKLFYLSNKNDLIAFPDSIKLILQKIDIESLLNKKVQTLSCGEKQRVKLAQVLLINPDVILLDEPISNLDIDNIKKICSLIDALSLGRTLIIVSHSKIDIASSSYQLILRGGKLYEE